MNRLESHLALLLVLSIAFPLGVLAQGGQAPVIVSTTLSYGNGVWQIVINGRNFKPSISDPTVFFRDAPVAVLSASDGLVVASLATDMPAGTYLLTVTNSKKVSGTAYVTIGVTGPPGGVDQPIELTVDCTDGYGLDELLGAAGNRVSRTTININGFCDEQVNLFKSNVTFRPAPGSINAGIRKLFLFGAHGIVVEGLILRNMEATSNAAFDATNLRVDAPDWTAVAVHDSSSGNLYNPTFKCPGGSCIEAGSGGYLRVFGGTLVGQKAGSAVYVTNGGSIDVTETVIQNFAGAVEVASGGSAYFDRATIQGATGEAIHALGAVSLYQAEIKDNAYGVYVGSGGSADIRRSQIHHNGGTGAGTDGGVLKIDGTDILDNGGDGIGIGPGGRVYVAAGKISRNSNGVGAWGATLVINSTEISDNRGHGIVTQGISMVMLGNATVMDNHVDGINLGDLSFMEVTGSTSVTNNVGYGLFCAPAPTQYKVCCGNEFKPSGNASGDPRRQISCQQAGSPGI